jgi:hypothetical protein
MPPRPICCAARLHRQYTLQPADELKKILHPQTGSIGEAQGDQGRRKLLTYPAQPNKTEPSESTSSAKGHPYHQRCGGLAPASTNLQDLVILLPPEKINSIRGWLRRLRKVLLPSMRMNLPLTAGLLQIGLGQCCPKLNRP